MCFFSESLLFFHICFFLYLCYFFICDSFVSLLVFHVPYFFHLCHFLYFRFFFLSLSSLVIPSGHPSMYQSISVLLNFNDLAKISTYKLIWALDSFSSSFYTFSSLLFFYFRYFFHLYNFLKLVTLLSRLLFISLLLFYFCYFFIIITLFLSL